MDKKLKTIRTEGIKAGIRTPFNAKPSAADVALDAALHRAGRSLAGHEWCYDLKAIAKEAAESGGLEFWAGEEHHAINVLTDEGMRVLTNFACMHSARDIVEAPYQHTGCDAYFEEKAATLKKHGLLQWSAELDTGNLSRLVHLINLYAHCGAR